ncbi:PREDICTED: dolichyldiphosphatase 1 isoform X1 [Gekko japonicus]|uniref:Dolichyldiphosphatase 1 isoform X1 n=1 Tax=Gekko japonicus TaxID=146911 RepID=A0ABM1JZK5_GEKJA|nr:PREDICTED: dolichyldiphosphatase 1 isoform X1 [Gekko japonicus]
MAAVGECSLSVPWKSVSLTHVEYPAGDLTGRLLAYVSLGPIFIIVGFVTLIVFKRELHTISFLGGLLLNEGVNWLIKNIVRETRPCADVFLPLLLRNPSVSAFEVRNAFQPLPVYVVFLHVLFSLPLFKNAPNKQRQVPGLVVETRAVPLPPNSGLPRLIQQSLPDVPHLEPSRIWRGRGKHHGCRVVCLHTGDLNAAVPTDSCMADIRVLLNPRYQPHPKYPMVRIHSHQSRSKEPTA